MAKWGELTPVTVHQIAWEVRDGEADPEDARRLLELFCQCSDDQLLRGLIAHLRNAFTAYLAGEKSMEMALGLVRKKGRPKADEQVRQEMAAALLRMRLENVPHQKCLEVVSERFGWGKTIIGEAWCGHKQDALIVLLLEQTERGSSWSDDESARLCEIFRDEPWFIAPGKSLTKPA